MSGNGNSTFQSVYAYGWLAGNTHLLGQCGYDWSSRSMGKAINALYDALILIEQDGGLFLNESFMNGIFNKIHADNRGVNVPLPRLAEAMSYQYEKKQTNAIDGSKVLPFDQLNAELFF